MYRSLIWRAGIAACQFIHGFVSRLVNSCLSRYVLHSRTALKAVSVDQKKRRVKITSSVSDNDGRRFVGRRFSFLIAVIVGFVAPYARAVTPPTNWNYSASPVSHLYSDDHNNTGFYETAACIAASPGTYTAGNYKYDYSGPHAGIDPNYGFGCYYDYRLYQSDGHGGWILQSELPNWFAQSWAVAAEACPTGSSTSDGLICWRLRPAREQCPWCGDPVGTGNGEEYQDQTDYISRSGSERADLTFAREYSSAEPLSQSISYGTSPLGGQWFIKTYGRFLSFTTEGSNQYVYAVRGPGDVELFQLQAGAWNSYSYNNDTLVQLAGPAPAAWQYTNDDDQSVEVYDASGRLLSITSRTGLVTTLHYSDAGTPGSVAPFPGLLISVTSPFGRALNFSYDSNGLLIQMTDPEGQQYTYSYEGGSGNEAARLSSVTYPDGKTRSYLYEAPVTPPISGNGTVDPNAWGLTYSWGLHIPIDQIDYNTSDVRGANVEKATYPLTGVVDENGNRFATITYDTKGRATSTEHAGGVEHTGFVYNTNGTTDVTDALGTSRHFTFQTVLGVRKGATVTQPCADCAGTKTSSKTYDGNGNVASRTDYSGIQTVYSYDLTRNLQTSRTEAYGTPEARTITTQWHPTFRLPTLITEPGKTTAYSYDSQGNLLQRTITDTALGTSRSWSYTYNTLGLLVTVDGPRTDLSDVTTYAYDTQGNLTSVTNALNQVTQITSYDASGRPLTIIDPNGLVTTLGYSPRGWLTSRAMSDGVDTETTSYTYDGVGQLIQVTLPDNSAITYTYDAAHRLTGIADSLGNHISYTLDAMGNRTAEDVYDPSNTLTQTRSHVFDGLNHLAQDIGAQNQTSNYSYDNSGNLTDASDPLSHTTTHAYDALNRLIQVIDPDYGMSYYGYDAHDHLTSVTDPRALQTTYTYDALDNLLEVVSPDTGTTTNTYDAAGNLLTTTDARGAVTTYTYDALNRVTQIDAALGAATHTTTYQYDSGPNAVGRLTAISDADSTTTYAYDSFGRLSAKTQQFGGVSLTVAYAYDGAGRVSQITYPSGKVVSYGYDTQGRIDSVGVGLETILDTVSYSPLGIPTAWMWGNGTGYSRPLDSDGRIASFTLNGTPNILTYDAADRITDRTGELGQSFSYDGLNRLTGYSDANAIESFSYDAVGNRTQFSDGTNADTYTYAATSNRLTDISGINNRSYSYAANGNITGDGSHTYIYDARNRLVGVDNIATYVLNGLGQRIEKDSSAIAGYGAGDADGDGAYTTADGNAIVDQILELGTAPGNPDCNEDTQVNVQDLVCLNLAIASGATPVTAGIVIFVYDEQGQIIGEYNSIGAPIEETVYLGNQPVAVLKQNNTYYIHTDQLNTARAISNAADTIVWRWDSDPFGTTAANEDPDMDGVTFTYNLRFPGQYYDAETGLHYNYFRYYDPRVGRYITSDPTGLAGGLDTYGYAAENPEKFSDPLGLFTVVTGFSGSDLQAWAAYRQTPAGKRESRLNELGGLLQELINQSCTGDDRQRAQDYFDRWVLYIDPNIDDPLKRLRGTEADTPIAPWTTRVNYGFFAWGRGLFSLAHEFRHLSPVNQQMTSPSYIENRLRGDATSDPSEIDADKWARDIINGICTCK